MFLTLVIMMWILPKAAKRIATGKTGTSHDYVTKGTLSHMVEVMCVFFREEVARPVLGDKTDRFIPYIWTIFFFILINNLLGMVPLLDATALVYQMIAGVGDDAAHVVDHDAALIGDHGSDTLAMVDDTAHGEMTDGHEATHEPAPAAAHGEDALAAADGEHGVISDDAHATSEDAHASDGGGGGMIWFHDLTQQGRHSHFHGIGGTATGNISVTFALALISIVVVIAAGIKNLGLLGFLEHMTLGAPVFLWPLTIVLEIIGLIAKPFALMVRLFANMTAGHVMLAALLGFCTMAFRGTGPVWGTMISVPSIIFATAIGVLELLVAFIQAYVFAFLTTMFIAMFQEDHHHEHEHDAHGVEA